MTEQDNKIAEVLKALQIEQLNAMQKATLQHADSPKDLILLSPTGSGKTLAFLLPLLYTLNVESNKVQTLILTPSRELALQIDRVFRSMNTAFRSCCCYGGHSVSDEKKSIQGNHPQLIIGTPGRILDHFDKGNIDASTIETIIIDEFDKSLELGFQEEMAYIIDYLEGLRKRVLISATDCKEIPLFAGVDNSIKLDFTSDELADRLTLQKVLSPEKDKIETLFNLLCLLGQESSIVFCNYRESVDRVYQLLREKKMNVECFHGGMEQPHRERALYKFRNGSCNVLISTDLAARGLDIPDVEHIIHYHLPVNQEAFTHRNGRTARWDASGNSYIILNDQEHLPDYIDEIPTFEIPEVLPKPLPAIWQTLYVGKGKKDKLSRGDVAGFFYKIGKLTSDDLGAIDVKEHYTFVAVKRKKVKQLLTLIRGEKIKKMKTIIEEAD